MEEGLDTLVEGKQAHQTFKETLNLHLAKHIQKEIARERRDRSASESDPELAEARKNLATKRKKITAHSSSKKPESAQSQSMTFVTKPEGTADIYANDASTSMQAKSGGFQAHVQGVSVEQIMARAKKNGYSDTESIQYKDLKQKLEKQVAKNSEERKETPEQASLYRSAQHLMDLQSNMSYSGKLNLAHSTATDVTSNFKFICFLSD